MMTIIEQPKPTTPVLPTKAVAAPKAEAPPVKVPSPPPRRDRFTVLQMTAPPASFDIPLPNGDKVRVQTRALHDSPYWIYTVFAPGSLTDIMLEWLSRPGPDDVMYALGMHGLHQRGAKP